MQQNTPLIPSPTHTDTASPPRPATVLCGPWLGLSSFLGLPLGGLAGYLIRLATDSSTVGVGTTGATAIGVLAAAVIGLIATVGSRVRQERWPWLGVVGAVLSAAPLAMFIGSMLLHR